MTWDWQSAHSDRLVTPEEAAAVVKSGDDVIVAMASPLMTPVATVQALVRRAPELHDVSIDTSWTSAGALGLVGPETEAAWSTRSAFVYSEPEYRALAEQNPQTNYVPLHPSFMGSLADTLSARSSRSDTRARTCS
jgi:acyl-CoA hydrolase